MGSISGFDMVNILIRAFGGLALFIYGMVMLSGSLEKVSSGRMEKVLESLTNNVVKSVLLGAFVTAVVQSSSATTVIVVGLANAGILKLSSAIGVIMGANIGTTITGQILRLADLENNENVGAALKLLTPRTLAPFIALIGVLCILASKKDKVKSLGEIFLGLGILFTGMLAMTDSVEPLAELEGFKTLFSTLTNPVLGILVGCGVTMIIQSSSASIGILQAISTTGAITFSAAFPIILGQNIGTCITPIMASIGASKSAKRTACVHLYFNIIGTLLFVSGIYLFQHFVGFSFWNDRIDMAGIANFHTIFNVSVTLIFIPFTKLLEKLAMMTFPDKADAAEGSAEAIGQISLSNLDDLLMKSPSLAIQQSNITAVNMGKIALFNFKEALGLFKEYNPKLVEKLNENETNLDRMEDRLNAYLVKLTDCELTEVENHKVTVLLHLTSEFERIGDYTMNLIEVAGKMNDANIRFSESAIRELHVIAGAVEEIISMAVSTVENNDIDLAYKIEPLEETIDFLNETLKAKHIERLKSGKCTIECGVNFLDMLIDLERISDHCSNIAVYIIGGQQTSGIIFNHHDYIKDAHEGINQGYKDLYKDYMAKYSV